MAEKKCDHCGTNNASASVPFAAHESAMARAERHTKALIWVIALLIVLLVGTNAGWLWYESQFEETTTTIEAEADDGGNAVANNNGMVNYNGKG